jgi:catalase
MYRFNPFDLTKVWSHKDYPPISIGRMVLDRNPANFFAQIEQAAFEPSNMVPGIGPSPDKMLLGRLFSYADTHRYRIGTNYKQLPVNAPQVEVHSYSKDGSMRYRYNGNQPVYAPNSYGGPQADPQRYPEPSWFASGEIMRSTYTLRAEDNDFVQARNLYRHVMSATDREHLVNNIVGHMSQGVERFIQERTVNTYWYPVDPDLGARVARGLGLEIAPELTTSAGGE